jgi:hypothetical protein
MADVCAERLRTVAAKYSLENRLTRRIRARKLAGDQANFKRHRKLSARKKKASASRSCAWKQNADLLTWEAREVILDVELGLFAYRLMLSSRQ